ncbi:MAG: DUF4129 domain-containing protein [Thermovirgaceae bacterium]
MLFRLFLVISESLDYCLLYLYAASGFGVAGFVNPWSFVTLMASVTAVNLAMRRGSFRYLTIALANLAVFGLTLHLAWSPSGLFSVPHEPAAMMGFLSTWGLALFAGSRAAFLAWTADPPRYGLFDINVAIVFLLLVLASSFEVPLPGVHGLVFLAILSNALMLYFGSKSESSRQGSARALFALAALLVPVWLIGYSDALWVLESPAESVVDFSTPLFELILQGLLAMLLAIFRVMRLIPRRQAPTETSGGPSAAEGEMMPAGETSPFVEYLFMALAVIVVLLAALALLYMVWLLVRFLLYKKTGPQSGEGWSRPSFGAFLAAMFRTLKRVFVMVSIFLPLPITAERAYGFLLFWGKHKGRPRKSDETPYEYLRRLMERFPDRRRELSRITGSFVRHRYSKEGKVFERGLKWYVLKLYLRVPGLRKGNRDRDFSVPPH